MDNSRWKIYLESCLTDWQQQHDRLIEDNGHHHMSAEARANVVQLSYIQGRLDELNLLLKMLEIVECEQSSMN